MAFTWIEIDEFEDKLNLKDILLNQRQSSLLFRCEYLHTIGQLLHKSQVCQ